MLPRFAFPAAAAVLLAAGPATALMIAFNPPAQRALTAEVVVVGTVAAVEKETLEAAPARGVPNKMTYKVAVVKIDQPLAGADALTHLKVGFIPPPPPQVVQPGVPGRPILSSSRRFGSPDLKVGDQYVLFLNRHHEGNFYVMPFTSPPLNPKDENGKTELEEARKALAVVADPKKALTAEKAEDRAFAAAALVTKYRSHPEGGEAAEVPVSPEESKLILRGLADGEWKQAGRFGMMTPFTAFNQLGLTPQDGWNPPRPVPVPGRPNDFAATTKTAFLAWLDGPGRDYRVKRLVPKK